MKEKLKKIIEYAPVWAWILIAVSLFCGIIHIIAVFSVSFADFFNLKVASAFRLLFAKITGIFPVSFAEILIILLPLWIFIIVFFTVRLFKADRKRQVRFLTSVFAVLTLFYSTFVLTFASAYRGRTLEEKLGLERANISAEEIYNALTFVSAELYALSAEVTYTVSGESEMPYKFSALNDSLNAAYKSAAEKYDFLGGFGSNVKEIMLSEPMTYTHISGVYTFFTGEANVNVNYPDYIIPYTVAHEMAHQRGIAREDEANFVAFLICLESDDTYIKYSGYFNIFEYLFYSLCRADLEMAREFRSGIPSEIMGEIEAYSAFFEKYSDNIAADLSDMVNNSYLISQGQPAGVKSYGLVTELTVAYYKNIQR